MVGLRSHGVDLISNCVLFICVHLAPELADAGLSWLRINFWLLFRFLLIYLLRSLLMNTGFFMASNGLAVLTFARLALRLASKLVLILALKLYLASRLPLQCLVDLLSYFLDIGLKISSQTDCLAWLVWRLLIYLAWYRILHPGSSVLVTSSILTLEAASKAPT